MNQTIKTIKTKILNSDSSLVNTTEESPKNQFITPEVKYNEVIYKLKFIQVINDTLYVIYSV